MAGSRVVGWERGQYPDSFTAHVLAGALGVPSAQVALMIGRVPTVEECGLTRSFVQSTINSVNDRLLIPDLNEQVRRLYALSPRKQLDLANILQDYIAAFQVR